MHNSGLYFTNTRIYYTRSLVHIYNRGILNKLYPIKKIKRKIIILNKPPHIEKLYNGDVGEG